MKLYKARVPLKPVLIPMPTNHPPILLDPKPRNKSQLIPNTLFGLNPPLQIRVNIPKKSSP